MTVRVKIHRGAAQVGGSCVELECGGKRLLLDLGMPLDAEEGEVPLPDVPGLRGGDGSLLGIVVSHLHGDHCGLVPHAAPEVPLAMGPIAARILREAEFFTDRAPLPAPRWSLVDRQPFEVGPFRITPYQVEHSALDAFALLVEAGGRRLFYTGDFRAHGNDRDPWLRLLADPPRGVHALLMEGTQLGEGRAGEGPSEADLGRTLARRFHAWPGLVLAAWSSQNLDRLRTFHEAALEAGRTLMVDLYTATLAAAAGVPGIPVPGLDGLEVYCRRRERVQVKEAGAFGRVRQISPLRIYLPRGAGPPGQRASAHAAALHGPGAGAGRRPAGLAGHLVDVAWLPGGAIGAAPPADAETPRRSARGAPRVGPCLREPPPASGGCGTAGACDSDPHVRPAPVRSHHSRHRGAAGRRLVDRREGTS